MISIRRGMFETNSSSMHSFIIMKKDKYRTVDELEKDIGIYRIGEDPWITEENSDRINLHIYDIDDDIYYGRFPFQVLSSLEEKLKYYIASECHTKDDIKNVENVLREIFSNIKEIKYSSDKYWGNRDYCPYGYAQNYGYFSDTLKKNNISLREFLTNDKYVVIIDGDEYQEFVKFKDAGLINFKEIDKIYTFPDSTWEYTRYDDEGNVAEFKEGSDVLE